MSDKIDEIKRRNYHIAQSDIVWLVAEVERMRQHLRRVRKAIGDINGARAQDEAALDSLALDLDEYQDSESGRLV